MDGLGEAASLVEIGLGRFTPQQIRVGSEGKGTGDRKVEASSDPEKPFGGAAVGGDEGCVGGIDVRRDELRAVGICPGDEHGGHIQDVRGQPRRDKRPNELAGRNEDFAAEVTALFRRRELIFEVNACGTGLDHGLHQLKCVEWPAEARLGIRHDRSVPIAGGLSVSVIDHVRPLQGLVDVPYQRRHAVGRIQALIRIHLARGVVVRRDLPTADVNGLEAGPYLLDRLVTGDGAKGGNVVLAADQVPETARAQLSQRVSNTNRPAQTIDVGPLVGAHDSRPPHCWNMLLGGRSMSIPSVERAGEDDETLIHVEGEEVRTGRSPDQPLEDLASFAEAAGRARGRGGLQGRQLFVENIANELGRHDAAVVELGSMPEPLPDLCP